MTSPVSEAHYCLCVSVFVFTQLPEDLNALWAYVTFYGGKCQLNLNKKVTHLVMKEPKGVSTRDAPIHFFFQFRYPESGYVQILIFSDTNEVYYEASSTEPGSVRIPIKRSMCYII